MERLQYEEENRQKIREFVSARPDKYFENRAIYKGAGLVGIDEITLDAILGDMVKNRELELDPRGENTGVSLYRIRIHAVANMRTA